MDDKRTTTHDTTRDTTIKALHSGTLDVSAGGPAMSTYLTLRGLREAGVDAQIIMPTLPAGGRLRGEDVPVHYTAAPRVPKIGWSPTMKGDMRRIGDYDIYHAQGIWLYHTYAIVDIAREKGKPYIITPRGMLYPQDIAKSSTFFKRLSLRLRLLRDLNGAACVHVTCGEEMRHCRELGVTSPIAVIPNPVEIKDYPPHTDDGVFRVCYIGRLSPRKNVEGLIRAYAAANKGGMRTQLLIIGGGDSDYERFLREEARRLGVTDVAFAGFLSGKEKDAALATASLLVMPSEFENLGNVVLEGLVRRIPCIATKGAPWEELVTRRCGWWVEYSQDAINAAVNAALHTPGDTLAQMGARGRTLMEERYSVNAVAADMKALYEWIVAGARRHDAPTFVNIP